MSILKLTYHSMENKYSHEIVLECGVSSTTIGTNNLNISAAVIFPYKLSKKYIECREYNLMKNIIKLTPKQLKAVADYIKEVAIDWNIAYVEKPRINKIGMKEVKFLSMDKAINGLRITPQFLLINDEMYPGTNKSNHKIPYKCFIAGDCIYMSMAAADIIARDARNERNERIKNENAKEIRKYER